MTIQEIQKQFLSNKQSVKSLKKPSNKSQSQNTVNKPHTGLGSWSSAISSAISSEQIIYKKPPASNQFALDRSVIYIEEKSKPNKYYDNEEEYDNQEMFLTSSSNSEMKNNSKIQILKAEDFEDLSKPIPLNQTFKLKMKNGNLADKEEFPSLAKVQINNVATKQLPSAKNYANLKLTARERWYVKYL